MAKGNQYSEVLAGVWAGDIWKSDDGLTGYTGLTATGGAQNWIGISVNPTNGEVYAVDNGGDIWKSDDGE